MYILYCNHAIEDHPSKGQQQQQHVWQLFLIINLLQC